MKPGRTNTVAGQDSDSPLQFAPDGELISKTY
jgi:hypothetical protein